MFKRQLTLVAIALLFSLPTAITASNTAMAGDIDVQAGNVRVNIGSPSSGGYRTRTRRYCYKYKRHGRYRYKCYSRPIYRSYDDDDDLDYYPVDSRGRVYCGGNSTYSRQDVSQIDAAGITIVESSVSNNGCY